MSPSANENHVQLNDQDVLVGVVAPLLNESNAVPLRDILYLATGISGEVTAILVILKDIDFALEQPPHVKSIRVTHNPGNGPIGRIVRYLKTQVDCTVQMVRQSHSVRIWILYQGETMVLPIIVARILGKPTIVIVGGNWEKERRILRDNPLPRVLTPARHIAFSLATRLVVYYANAIDDFGLSRYESKTSVAPRHLPDTGKFRIARPIELRAQSIGFIGRLSSEKNPVALIQAMTAIARRIPDIELHVVGDGPLRDTVKEVVSMESLNDRVLLHGWLNHDEIPELLNRLRLLVIPSDSEGLPNAMLEAMACGTPVLARSVGSIPEMLTENETGFLLESSEPDVIANRVVSCLEASDITKISRQAREYVIAEFAVDKVTEKWRGVVRDTMR